MALDRNPIFHRPLSPLGRVMQWLPLRHLLDIHDASTKGEAELALRARQGERCIVVSKPLSLWVRCKPGVKFRPRLVLSASPRQGVLGMELSDSL